MTQQTLSQVTSVVHDSDRTAVAGVNVWFGMIGREVAMIVKDSAQGPRLFATAPITGDVLGNGMNRSACEKALFKAYLAE